MAKIAPLAKLIEQLRALPGIGTKSAQRLAYHILDMDDTQIKALTRAILDAKTQTHYCSQCHNLTDTDPCRICASDARDSTLLCVVEQPRDAEAMERTHDFKGRYHVLHGALSPLEGIGPADIKIKELLERLKTTEVREIIMATDPDVEGEATAMYLAKLLKPLGIKITRIAHGLPVGSDLEYADEITLAKALENRREM